jgi:hypothetical protein
MDNPMVYLSLTLSRVEGEVGPHPPVLRSTPASVISSISAFMSAILFSVGGFAFFVGRHKNGKVTVTDGRSTESQELIAGFALFESKQEAVAWGTHFLGIAGEGACEMRPLAH